MPTNKDVVSVFGLTEDVFDHFEPVPAGIYNLEVTSAEPRQSKQNEDNWYVNVTHRILAGPLDNDEYDGSEFQDRLIFQMLFLNQYKSDGEPARSLAETATHVRRMIGDLPEELQREPGPELARAISNVLSGANYENARVGIQESKDGNFPPKNVIRLPKKADI